MELSRRSLLTGTAALLAGSRAALARSPGGISLVADAAASEAARGAAPSSGPIVLCWNENPYGPSPAARAVMSSTIPGGCRYPDAEIEELTDVLAKREGMPADHIVIGSGSGELLCSLGIAAQPTYTEMTHYAEHFGAKIRFIAVDKQLRHDLSAMRAAVSERTSAVYICNPSNPTGTVVGAAAIRSFVESLPDSVTAIVDEAYLDFVDDPEVKTMTDLVASGKRVVVLRTFSKIHGMAGVRCGYGVVRADIAREIAAARTATPNIFAMRAARASLGDTAFLADTRKRILASRSRIKAELTRLGLAYAIPQGNFVFFDTGVPLAQFTQFMKARNILVGRRFAPYENWCRITIGTEPEVEAFLQGLRAFAGHRAAA